VAEVKTPAWFGYSIETVVLDYEIFRLVSSLAASPVISSLAHRAPGEPAWPWLKKAEFPEVCRLLVSIAAIVRNRLDLSSDDEIDANRIVGKLTFEASSKTVDLTLREACNKILHAAHVNPDEEDADGEHKGSLRPFVHLYGAHRHEDWKATLSIYEFAAAAWRHT
jgi:hypothetical protein